MVDPQEFEPLPFYPWINRPDSVPLTNDEAGTALYLAKGDLKRAAELLKVRPAQLSRLVKRSPQLQRIQARCIDDTRTTKRENPNPGARIVDAAGRGMAAAEIRWLTASDLPPAIAEGLRDGLRRKIAEETSIH